jgi:two-component system response regulator YesN
MSYHILIVDDDEDFRSELSDFLNRYHVLEAPSGDVALKLIRKPHTIDLVILDFRMPGTNGIEVLKKMRELIPEVGIIMLTGEGSKDVIVEALRGNADDYFEKPVDPRKLEESIEKILKSRASLQVVHSGQNQKIERAKRLIEKNYDKMVNLTDLASELCLSPKYFSRLFKEDVGMGFNDYKLKIKTEKAQNLLVNTGYTIHQIAERFGYKNLESFIRLFKKTTGMTPAAYRKKQRSKKGK